MWGVLFMPPPEFLVSLPLGFCKYHQGGDFRRATTTEQAQGTSSPELEAVVTEDTIVRAKAIVTFKLSLFSKLGIITALELGRGVGSNPKRYQETKGNLHVRLPPDSLHAGMETSTVDDELGKP
ncbi:Phosphoglycerate kinase [Actinidia chinensis var. chinensis]|uniref:Phosphoglycerate kinase n=1 Tax=Actinidia chinensis var. chinensis TaxID=1590841 RepID=A0A2R6QGK1_ACTCC|nr:Phosphoglycerate kinase [Actinidia chinensis var. chinensis]